MASSPSAPKPVDPNTIIHAQEQANRVNRITPFGSQTYGPDGSLTTTLPQGTQTAFDNITKMAGNQQQLNQNPTGDLQSALMSKVMGNTGQKSSPQSMPQIQANGKPGNDAWQAALSQVWRH
jgi:hypothetical protein